MQVHHQYLAKRSQKSTSDLDPEEYGWIHSEQVIRYEFKWFEGEQLPKIIKDVIIDTDHSEVEEDNIHYDSDSDPEDDIESST
ncbi:hypothetical protein FQA39_LY10744 [Lamprigera yunnana]|nr:hypothetical protein FQA39_LY10744 [Lamprigera yunnana]